MPSDAVMCCERPIDSGPNARGSITTHEFSFGEHYDPGRGRRSGPRGAQRRDARSRAPATRRTCIETSRSSPGWSTATLRARR